MFRPWYRSRLFWFGLPGVIALLWGWLAFPQASTVIRWQSWETQYWCADRSGVFAVGIVRDKSTGFQRFSYETDLHDRGLASEETQFFPTAGRRELLSFEDWSQNSLSCSYWLLLLVYFAAWLTILCFWQRRKARLMKLCAAPPP
jgi:hypothetical protein